MSEDKAPYGNTSRNSKNQEEPRSIKNHSELKSVAEEMAEALKEAKNHIDWVNEYMTLHDKSLLETYGNNYMNLHNVIQEALEKFNKLKEE